MQQAVGARRWLALAMVLACWALVASLFTPTAQADEEWDGTVDEVVAVLEEIPAQHASDDVSAVEGSIRRAYYETYQVSGLEDQIKHRLGRARADAFQQSLLDVRQLARDGAPDAEVGGAVEEAIALLREDVEELGSTEAISDQWTRVATEISDTIARAVEHYEAGDGDAAYREATDAYLGHYEADGLEKATIAYIGNSRVSAVEAGFRELRTSIRAEAPLDEVRATAEGLSGMVQEDAAQLDAINSSDSGLGWTGFFASFFILLREGAEALLVVAAVVTYVLKAGRRNQLGWVFGAVGAALLVSAGLAVVLGSITASVASGFSQEVVEGVAGLLAVVMLVYASGWILGKSDDGSRLQDDLERSSKGGTWTLILVVFFAVVREGAETILFFVPITAAASTSNDHLMIWTGVGSAVLILAVLFVLVWRFGVRLPLKPFFKWTAALLALLAVTIAGGAAKEFQDATLLGATPVSGVPEVALLGLYPTVETLVAQLVAVAIIVAFNLLHRRQSRRRAAATPGDRPQEAAQAEDSATTSKERIPQ